MLNKIATSFTKLVERYLPDPFIFVILLSIITLLGASLFTPSTSIEVINAWGVVFGTY